MCPWLLVGACLPAQHQPIPDHASSCQLMLPRCLAHACMHSSRNTTCPGPPLAADVTIGAWMLAFNTTPFDDRRLCETNCSATSLAVYDMPKCAGQNTRLVAHGMGKGITEWGCYSCTGAPDFAISFGISAQRIYESGSAHRWTQLCPVFQRHPPATCLTMSAPALLAPPGPCPACAPCRPMQPCA